MQVAIDTATDIASLALVNKGLTLAELTWRTNRNHTIQLLPNLEQLFKLTDSSSQSLTAVIVGLGPGSFNGLRVGVSAAKGLAFSLNIPLVGINSLEVSAYQYALTGLPVCPVINAGRDEVATAIYQTIGGKWQQTTPDCIITLEKLCSLISQPTLFCGEFVPQIAEHLKLKLGEKALIASPLTDLRRSSFLAELGLKRFHAGDTDNIATLQPIYLRRPPITQAKKL
ncbi:MAG: tRNA (adenosine(37)-N6)-threonylcarbamoyltransferase complex dimerization subunit type 1 TsaB [Dehalococcoidales bacterium]|nr:tRNA (adenosine(37)-N6)-threonylcarbamoyltransferase complex dimerization subunit type 1 TsaB [Dehalococcoidales bacterium]